MALREQDRVDESLAAFDKALALKPDFVDAYNNLGIAHRKQGRINEAIDSYQRALFYDANSASAYINLANILSKRIFLERNSNLLENISNLLDRGIFVRPNAISDAAISLLKLEPSLQRILKTSSIEKPGGSSIGFIYELCQQPLLLKLMSVCPITDVDLEKLFRGLRARLLFSIDKIPASEDILTFQSALALQCFTNEYIYDANEDEVNAIKKLETKVEYSFTQGDQPLHLFTLCLASYRSLNSYKWRDRLMVSSEIKDVAKRQVLEPEREEELKPTIPILEGNISEVSRRVKKQYEENPYPRWLQLGLPLRPLSVSEFAKTFNLLIYDDAIKAVEAPQILIAGCGTGQQSISTASTFKNSTVLSVDLSLPSLAYAKRKTEELGLQNIEYILGDILNLEEIGRRFDIIESVGVLHHMEDPMVGWKVLCNCLEQGGLMKIGLYSQLARDYIVKVRNEIKESKQEINDSTIRTLRNRAMNSAEDHHIQLRNFSDFYSLSEFRDLVFHVQEHRFNLPQIKNCLAELDLKFCGFEQPPLIGQFKRMYPDDGSLLDLNKWHAFEENNPHAFSGMYQFWCQKNKLAGFTK